MNLLKKVSITVITLVYTPNRNKFKQPARVLILSHATHIKIKSQSVSSGFP